MQIFTEQFILLKSDSHFMAYVIVICKVVLPAISRNKIISTSDLKCYIQVLVKNFTFRFQNILLEN